MTLISPLKVPKRHFFMPFLSDLRLLVSNFRLLSKRPCVFALSHSLRVKERIKRTPSPYIDNWIKRTERYVTCIGVKIPSQVDSDLAKTSPSRGESDKGDESESELHPEGGDDRYKVIMILLRSHRPSVEAGILPRDPSHPMSEAGINSTGWGALNPSHDLVVSNARASGFQTF